MKAETHSQYPRKQKIVLIVALSVVAVMILTLFITSVIKYEPGRDNMKPFKNTAEVKKYIKKSAEKKVPTQGFLQRIFGKRSSNDGTKTTGGGITGGADSNSSFGGHSTTNNQVEGVSESDVVHTDGKHIFALGYYGLTIAQLNTFMVAVRIEFDNFFPSDMYLLEAEGLLVILGGKIEEDIYNGSYGQSITSEMYRYWYKNTECVRVYDIEKLLAIKTDLLGVPVNSADVDFAMTRELAFPRCYVSATRMIGTKLYLVYNLNHSYYDYAKRKDVITIPEFSDSEAGGQYRQLSAKNIYASPDNGRSYGFIVTAVADLADSGIEVKAYFGSASTVYASQKAFYISFNRYSRRLLAIFDISWEEVGQKILRFEINGASLKYKGAGNVKGFTLNQFGFDEYTYDNGKTFFRAATTLDGESFITIFNTKMEEVGKLSGLGKPGEQIYSVRFRGDTAVVVTFRQTDPLYVIDLSEPKKPKKLSELEIPGVSDYLHFLNTNPDLVFAVGRKENLSGIKVSLFDISTVEAATEIGYYEPSITGYSYSEATYNHKAIMYFMPDGKGIEIFAFPVNAYSYKLVGNRYISQGYCALLYYTVDAAGSLNQVEVLYSPEAIDNISNYWYYRDNLRRSVMADGYLYLVGVMNIERYAVDANLIPDLDSKQVLKISEVR